MVSSSRAASSLTCRPADNALSARQAACRTTVQARPSSLTDQSGRGMGEFTGGSSFGTESILLGVRSVVTKTLRGPGWAAHAVSGLGEQQVVGQRVKQVHGRFDLLQAIVPTAESGDYARRASSGVVSIVPVQVAPTILPAAFFLKSIFQPGLNSKS
jgi:hypothetical protein